MKLKRVLQNNLYILRIAFREAPAYSAFRVFFPVWSSIIVYIEHTYMIGFIINSIQYARPFWQPALFICVVFVTASTGTNVFCGYINRRLAVPSCERINRRIRMELYKKAAETDLRAYDDPKFYNDFIWAMSGAAERVPMVLETAGGLLGAFAGIAAAFIYISAVDPAGIIFAAVSVVVVLLTGSMQIKTRFSLEERLRPIKRKRDYTGRVLYLADYAKELRLGAARQGGETRHNGFKEKLLRDFDGTLLDMEKEVRKTTKKLSLYRFVVDFLADTLMHDGLYIVYLLYRTIVLGAFGYGSMVVLYRSVNTLKNRIRGLSMTFPKLTEHSLYIEKLRSFLENEPGVKSPAFPRPVPEGPQRIRFENVSFSYGADCGNVLESVSLTIEPGEKAAIVGYNGAGKTTLVKLLMRLYDPTEGVIYYGGADIREYDLTEYREHIGTVFQDFQIFSAGIAENIVMNTAEPDRELITKLLTEIGFSEKLSSLKNGLDTILTREFDDEGTNLSGGEAQKLAICRALYKGSPLIVLDEPSSALDPIAEYTLNNTMLRLGREKTVVFISHRLSTTKMADKILMFENGKIIEAGSHAELLAGNGKYARLYSLQAEKYRSAAVK